MMDLVEPESIFIWHGDPSMVTVRKNLVILAVCSVAVCTSQVPRKLSLSRDEQDKHFERAIDKDLLEFFVEPRSDGRSTSEDSARHTLAKCPLRPQRWQMAVLKRQLERKCLPPQPRHPPFGIFCGCRGCLSPRLQTGNFLTVLRPSVIPFGLVN